MHCGTFLKTGVAMAALAVAAPAWAQETLPAAPAAESDDAGIQDIIVTAQRREESLQRAAIAVSAVTGDDLIAAGISDTVNLSKVIPSLVVQPAGGGSANFYLRGVGTLQGNSYGENAVAFNFNGVYVARPSAPIGAFYDLERLEVVKGPQGTLYGRNATGGAINVLPNKPELGEFGGDMTVEYGNYNTIKGQGALNIPLGDKVALRFAGQLVDRDGYASDGYDDEEGQAFRASLLIKPTDGWSALLVADYFHQGGKGLAGHLSPSARVPLAPPLESRIGGADPRSIAALTAFANANPPFGFFLGAGLVIAPRTDGFNDSKFYGLTATIEGDLGFGTLTVIPAYRRSEPRYRFYFTGFQGDVDEQADQTSLEVRLTSNGDQALRYVLGAYYFDEKQDALNFFSQGAIATTLFTPRLKTESKAVFGQATYDISPTFRVVAGARYTREDKKQVVQIAAGGPTNPNPTLSPEINGRLSTSRVTWKAGVEWDAGPQSLVYANVSTGFKSGGFFVAAPPTNTFAPERLTAYTVGSKNRFLDNRLQVNVEAFYWRYRDQQISFVGGVSQPLPVAPFTLIAPGGITVNAGQARMYGVELDMRFAATPNDMFSANVQYLNGKYNELKYTAFSAAGAPILTGCSVSNARLANPGIVGNPARLFDLDCSGRQTINSPKWAANFAYEHTFELGDDLDLVAGASTRVESSRSVGIDYLPELTQGSYMTSDAFLTLEGPEDRWALTGYINNIEDKAILSGGVSRPVFQTPYVSLRPPRTYGVRASVKF